MKLPAITLLASTILLFSACTNTPTPTAPKGVNSQFNTSVRDSGLKIFSLKATISNQGLNRANPAPNAKKLTRWLEYELAQQLASSQFCSSGHTEIERSIGTGFAIIRGECNELAQN